MARKDRMSGNEAVSFAIRQINPDVMPAFPITPSTEIPQMVSTYIANGEIDTEFVPVESEHSAMSAAIGSEAAGARTLTATSSAGLALMWEELLLAASNRMPIALALVNRTLSGPININCDHSDGMGARDTGWIQIYAENNQEAYDNFIQAYPIAESAGVHLPIMICQDGFITSHAVENIELLEDEEVKNFRRNEIMELQQDIVFDTTEKYVGKEFIAMIEGKISGEHAYIARTYMDCPGVDSNIFVMTDEELMTGDFVKVKVTGTNDYDLIGELI